MLERIFKQGAVDAAFHPDASIHDPGHDRHGPAELRQASSSCARSSGLSLTALESVEEGDRVALRYQGEGAHSASSKARPCHGQARFLERLVQGRGDPQGGLAVTRTVRSKSVHDQLRCDDPAQHTYGLPRPTRLRTGRRALSREHQTGTLVSGHQLGYSPARGLCHDFAAAWSAVMHSVASEPSASRWNRFSRLLRVLSGGTRASL